MSSPRELMPIQKRYRSVCQQSVPVSLLDARDETIRVITRYRGHRQHFTGLRIQHHDGTAPDVAISQRLFRKGWDYYVPDDFGGAGVEKSFDKYLRGRPGVRTMQKNERGRIVGEVKDSFEPPRKGNDVYLTLDDWIGTA